MWKSRSMGVGAVVVVVVACVLWLAVFSGDDPEEMMGSDDPAERLDAVARLADEGDVAGLARATVDSDARVASSAILHYSRVADLRGAATARPLVLAMEDRRPAVRQAAASAMGKFRLRDKVDAAVLLRALADPNEKPKVRAAAAVSLGRLDLWDAVPPLINAMSDPNTHVRDKAGQAVQEIIGRDYLFRATLSESRRREIIAAISRDWPLIEKAHRAHIERQKEKGR